MFSIFQSIYQKLLLRQNQKTQNLQEATNQKGDNCLKGTIDKYNVMYYEVCLEVDRIQFQQDMNSSIKDCKKSNLKAIVLKLRKDQLQLADTAIKNGFEMHHAKNDVLVLKQWLNESKHDNFPAFSTHNVGCGGVVVNNQNEILLVQEANGIRKDSWNIPQGRLDLGENIDQAAIREVKEETGLDCQYLDLLAFRESQLSTFGRADLYFAFLLKMKNPEQQVNLDLNELKTYQWVKIQELDKFIENNQFGSPFQKQFLLRLQNIYSIDQNFQQKTFFDVESIIFKNSPYNIYYPKASI